MGTPSLLAARSASSSPSSHGRDVADAHRVPVALRDDDLPDLLRVRDAPVDADGHLVGAGLERAARHREVLRRERAPHVDRGEARRPRRRSGSSHTLIWRLRPPRIVTWPTPSTDSSWRRNTLSANSVVSRSVRFPRKRDGEDRRRVGVELLDDGLVDVPWELREDAVHVVAHLLRGDVDVLLEDERDEDLRDALGRDRAQLVDARDRVDRLLDLVGDLGLDLLGRGAREARDDDDGREVDVREAVDAEARVADAADDDEHEDEDRREDGPADAETGESLHGLVSFRRSVGALDLEAVREAAVRVYDDTFARHDTRPHLDGVAVAVPERDDALDDAVLAEDEDVRDARVRHDGGRPARAGSARFFGSETRAVTKRPGFRTCRGFGTTPRRRACALRSGATGRCSAQSRRMRGPERTGRRAGLLADLDGGHGRSRGWRARPGADRSSRDRKSPSPSLT